MISENEKVSSLVFTHNLTADINDELKSESVTKNSPVKCETKKSFDWNHIFHNYDSKVEKDTLINKDDAHKVFFLYV